MAELTQKPIDASTRYCAVYGHPVRHSASPAMQNAGIAALGLNWRYLAFEVHPDDLRSALAGALAMRFIGVNLTVPHKVLAVPLVDALDDSARFWGAVNTVRFEGRNSDESWRPLRDFDTPPQHIRSHGFNTDADAIAQALREDLGLRLDGAKVLLLGAGGAGRTAALKLASERTAELYLVNRTQSKAESVAGELRAHFPGLKTIVGYPSGEVDLVLNATSVGLRNEEQLPFDETRFSLRQSQAVYDMIYRPAETRLLRQAKAIGCRSANGLGMLLYQGARSLELWTGQPSPVDAMRRALQRNVYA
ncbi:MAG: shikimate dehydrogenase family protein [Limisphaerales bacterium]